MTLATVTATATTTGWPVMLSAVAGVFAVIAAGAAARRTGLLTDAADDSLLRAQLNVLTPAFVLSVLLGRKELLNPAALLLPPAVGFGTTLLGFGLALAVASLLGRRIGLADARQRRTFALCVGMFNYGFIPIPLAEALFRDEAGGPDAGVLGTLFVHNVGVDVAMWSVGLVVLAGRLDRGWWRPLINAPIASIVLALLMNATGTYRYVPAFLTQAFDLLGRCAIPAALVLTGATIADVAARAKLHHGTGVIASAVLLRLGLLPAAFLALAWLLPASADLKRVMVLEAAMPAAVFPIVLTRLYGGDLPTAVRVVLGTSALGLLTIPLWLTFGFGWLGVGP